MKPHVELLLIANCHLLAAFFPVRTPPCAKSYKARFYGGPEKNVALFHIVFHATVENLEAKFGY
ncbi:MAG TPA: hypothetical protein VKY85_26585 [Candidatus Angelobacter sp.]|nr:hypothetical protein [Candidatus Angelobacter sp.]